MNENEEVTPTPTTEEVVPSTAETAVEEAAVSEEVDPIEKVGEADNNAPDQEEIAKEEAKVATGEDFSQPHNAPGMEDNVPAEESAPANDEASA